MAISIDIENKQFLVPEAGDPCDTWRVYYTKLKKELGRDNARFIWLVTWAKNGSSTCTTNADFNKWLAKNEIDVSTASTRSVADVTEIGSNILGLGKGLTKVLSIGIPIALTAVLVVVILMIVKAGRQTSISDLTMLHPATRALSFKK